MIVRLAARAWNSAVAWGFLAAALRFGGNLLVLPLAVRLVVPEHLGLWYVFLSLGTFVGLLDLGFSTAATRAAGYLWGGADRLLPQGIVPPGPGGSIREPNLQLLAVLTRSLRRYYSLVGAAVFAVMVLGGGAWIWAKSEGLAGATSVRLAWVLFSLGGWLNLQGNLWPALLSGINGVRQAQQAFVGSLAAGYAVSVVGLLAGFGLWALVASSVVQGAALRLAGRRWFLGMSGLAGAGLRAAGGASLLPVLWPNAWRQALSSMGAFMILQANTLICSSALTLRDTASYGVSLQIMAMIAGVSAYWVNVKLPLITQLRAADARRAIAGLFAGRVRLTVLTYLLGMAGALLAAEPLLAWLRGRTLPLPAGQLAALLGIGLLELHHSQYAALVLTENRNPFVVPALASGTVSVALSLILTPRWGMWGLILAPGLVQAAFNNWWAVWRGLRGLGIPFGAYLRLLIRPGGAGVNP